MLHARPGSGKTTCDRFGTAGPHRVLRRYNIEHAEETAMTKQAQAVRLPQRSEAVEGRETRRGKAPPTPLTPDPRTTGQDSTRARPQEQQETG
jgi:hypothetical protein